MLLYRITVARFLQQLLAARKHAEKQRKPYQTPSSVPTHIL